VRKKATSTAQGAAIQAELPPRVQEALGELASAAREGLLALSVGVGLGVLAELLEEEVVEVVGAKGKHDPNRVAVRHGHEAGAVTLGGRRLPVERPRVRGADGSGELPLATYRHFADRDLLTQVVLERMLAGVSTRRYRRTQEPVGEEVEQRAHSTSKSSVSRAFVERTRKALAELMSRRLDDVRLAVLMLDGIDLKGRTNIVCLGIPTEGVKIPLGLWEGSTENATVATALLSDLVGRKERNVLDHLPERDRPPVKRRLQQAWALDDPDRALARLQALAAELERTHPGAAASLREGIAETLTLTRLGISGSLRRTLASTNPCESMIECVRRTSRNVKRWQAGEMALRWTAAGMLEAERQFRRSSATATSPSSPPPPNASSTVTGSRRSPSRSLERRVVSGQLPLLDRHRGQCGVNLNRGCVAA
jgi:putative transposase